MFLDFFLFELRLRLKSISTYIYFFLWLAIGFMTIAVEDFGPAGAGKILLNSPYVTLQLFITFSAFGMIIMSAIFGPSILRDSSVIPTR
jgi:ABC-2 type transport system permease protein